MTFEEFKREVCKETSELLGKELEIKILPAAEGDREYIGFKEAPEGDAVPMFRTENLEDAYAAGETPEHIAAELAKALETSVQPMPLAELRDYDTVKNSLLVTLSSGSNKSYLEAIPHRDLCDMAVIYRLMVSIGDGGKGSVVVTNSMLKDWGITQEQLDRDAVANSCSAVPALVSEMPAILGMMGVHVDDMPELNPMMYVVSNNIGLYGAGAILYPDLLDEVSEALGGEIVLIPSSVHEFLCMRNTGKFEAAEIASMIRDVNCSCLRASDILSDHAYSYKTGGKIEAMPV